MSIKKSELKEFMSKGIVKVVCFKKQYKVRVRTVEKVTEYQPSEMDPDTLPRLVKWALENGALDEDEIVMEIKVSKLNKPITLLAWDEIFDVKPKLNQLVITYKGQKGWAIAKKKFYEQLEDELLNLEDSK